MAHTPQREDDRTWSSSETGHTLGFPHERTCSSEVGRADRPRRRQVPVLPWDRGAQTTARRDAEQYVSRERHGTSSTSDGAPQPDARKAGDLAEQRPGQHAERDRPSTRRPVAGPRDQGVPPESDAHVAPKSGPSTSAATRAARPGTARPWNAAAADATTSGSARATRKPRVSPSIHVITPARAGSASTARRRSGVGCQCRAARHPVGAGGRAARALSRTGPTPNNRAARRSASCSRARMSSRTTSSTTPRRTAARHSSSSASAGSPSRTAMATGSASSGPSTYHSDRASQDSATSRWARWATSCPTWASNSANSLLSACRASLRGRAIR